jgi:hypothetical protein
LKSKITIAVLMLAVALCASANASTMIMYTFTGSNPLTDSSNTYNPPASYSITATAVDCTTSTGGCSAATVADTTHGLGISGNTDNEIADNDYVVLDFASIPSSVLSKATGVTITLYETVAGNSDANIVGTNTNPIGSPDQSVTQINSGAAVSDLNISLNNGGTLSPNTFTLNSTGAYDYYIVDLTGAGCGVVITSATLNFPNTATPEPGTFVMAGMALLGLGVTIKKRAQKA